MDKLKKTNDAELREGRAPADKTGGPAFPQPSATTREADREGMTLLDHFAGEVFPAVYRELTTWPLKEREEIQEHMGVDSGEDVAAEASYRLAEAMIRAKQRRERRS